MEPRPKARCKKCRSGIDHEYTHGGTGGYAYQYHQCRCEICIEGQRNRSRDYVERNRDAVAERNREYYEAHRDAIAEQKRRWHAANRDAIRERQHEYYDANRDALLERQHEYYDANRDALLERQRRWHAANRDAIRKRHREYNEANRDALLEQKRRYYDTHRETEGARGRKYRNDPDTREYLRRQARKQAQRRKSIPGPRNGLPWTPADDAIVCDGEYSLVEMCYRLGRSYPAVSGRRGTLRQRGEDVA